jgi:hypothetical protein
MKTLNLFGKIIFLLFSIFYLLVPFIYVIITKINHPNFKHLNNIEIIHLGFIVVVSILINIKLITPFFKIKSNS